MKRGRRDLRGLILCVLGGVIAPVGLGGQPSDALHPGTLVLLDAHNAYPENGRWADRLERALSTGLPLAIEQDLVWWRDPKTGAARSIVSHGAPFTGEEPSLEEYFLRRIRPVLEQAVRDQRRETWPVITLNLDFKTNEPEHHQAVLDLLRRYELYLVSARRTASASQVAPLAVRPMLVLTGSDDTQERSFHDAVPIGGSIVLFGAAHAGADGLPGVLTNYRRWANYSWAAVEPEGQPRAGDWTPEDASRLSRLVDAAHDRGLWIRFYTLNGHDAADTSNGWTAGYNFGSIAAARTRWEAAIRAGVDFVAVDQYEGIRRSPRPAAHYRRYAHAL
jgi:glycerophosphoryl diester phosphodiesterase